MRLSMVVGKIVTEARRMMKITFVLRKLNGPAKKSMGEGLPCRTGAIGTDKSPDEVEIGARAYVRA